MTSEAWGGDDEPEREEFVPGGPDDFERRFLEQTGMALESALVLILRVQRSVLRGDNLVDDAVQETVLALLRRRRKPWGVDPAGWIVTAAKRIAFDLVDKERTRRGYEDDAAVENSHVDEPDTATLAVEALRSADLEAVVEAGIASLPPEQEEVMRRSYDPREGTFDAVPDAELAAELGIPPGTVKSRKNAGKKKLKAFLEEIRDQLRDGGDDE